MRKGTHRVVAAILALSLIAASCGSDDSGTEAPGAEAPANGAVLTPELTRACDAVRALITWAETQSSYDPFETGVQVRQVAGLFTAAGKTATAEMMNGEATIYMSFGGMGAMAGMPAKVLVRECQ